MSFRLNRVFLPLLLASVAHASFCATVEAIVQVTPQVIGPGPRYIGWNQGHFMPASNTAAWIERAGVNVFRVWTSPSDLEPTDDIAPWGDNVSDEPSFNARRTALRADPENTSFINWPVWENRFETYIQDGVNKCAANHMLRELNSIGVTPLVVIDSRGWDLATGTWADRWEYWQKYYAMGYHYAKHFNVEMFETCNEPDQNSNPRTVDEYFEWARFADDALRCAVLDVNARYARNLQPKILAPTLMTFDNIDTYGMRKLNNIRKNYQGDPITHDNFQVYCTHQYNATAPTFVNQIQTMLTKIPMYHEAGQDLPIFYSEFNRYNTSTFRTQPATVSLDNPQQFTEVADILCSSMQTGVWGMTSFKFSETWRSDLGKYRTGYHWVWDDAPYNIGGAKKAVDMMKLFATGFAGERSRLQTTVSGSATSYGAYASVATSESVYRVFCNNRSTNDVQTTFDLSILAVTEGSTVTIEEVSASAQGQIVAVSAIPSTRKVAYMQPAQSVVLLTVFKGAAPLSLELTPVADSAVRGGTYADSTLGGDTSMLVKMNDDPSFQRISYLKFQLSGLPVDAQVHRAILELYGRNPVDNNVFNLQVYGSKNDTWEESAITWNNSPDHGPTTTTVSNQGVNTFPVGNICFDGQLDTRRLDVTQFVSKETAGDRTVTFMLSREMRHSDDADTTHHANISTREDADASKRPRLLLFYTPAVPVGLSLFTAD